MHRDVESLKHLCKIPLVSFLYLSLFWRFLSWFSFPACAPQSPQIYCSFINVVKLGQSLTCPTQPISFPACAPQSPASTGRATRPRSARPKEARLGDHFIHLHLILYLFVYNVYLYICCLCICRFVYLQWVMCVFFWRLLCLLTLLWRLL